MINTWETTISKLKERDDELVQEEMKNVDIKEELIAREQIIKGTVLFNEHATRSDFKLVFRSVKPHSDWHRAPSSKYHFEIRCLNPKIKNFNFIFRKTSLLEHRK